MAGGVFGVAAGVLYPAAGATGAAVEEVGEAMGADACVFFAALFEFVFDALLGGGVPQWRVETFGGGDGFGRGGDAAGFVGAGVGDDAGFAEEDLTGVEGVFEDDADLYIGPGFATGGGDVLCVEGVGDLPEGLTLKEEVFDGDDGGGVEWVGFDDGFPIVFVPGWFAVAIGDLAFVESFEDAGGHALAVAAAEFGDLGGGGEGGGEAEGGAYV